MAATLPIEIKFAQNLAGNEKKIRYKAVKKLKKFLKAKSSSKKDGFSTEDFLKIWKGLHYCMWMQDKPLVQEELSTTLTQLVHDLATTEAKLEFIKVFFMTEAREWNGIDVWRLDKFMMMVRNMLNESLVVMKKLKWDQTELGRLVQVFCEAVMNPDSDTVPDGLKIHFTDIYLDEVEKVGSGELTGAQLLNLLVPFIKFIQKAKNHVLVRRVTSRVFDPVLACVACSKRVDQNADTDNLESSEEEVLYKSMKFDGKLLSEYMFSVSQQDCVLSRNRPVLYNIVTKLQDLEKGVFPKKREIVISEGITNKDVQLAVNSLVSLETGQKHKKKKKKNKKGKEEVNENSDPNNNDDTSSSMVTDPPNNQQQPSTSSQIGGKRKHSMTESESGETMTKIKKKKVEEDTANADTKLKKLKNKFAKLDLRKGKDKKSKNIENEAIASGKNGKRVASLVSSLHFVDVESSKEPVTSIKNVNSTSDLRVSVEIPSGFSKSADGDTTTPKSHGGQKVHGQLHAQTASAHAAGVHIPEIVIDTASPATINNKNSVPVEDRSQDGEIEIIIPTKKFKGTPQQDEKSPRSNFAAFDGTRPPVAFVRRSISKLKKTPSSLKTPGSARSSSTGKHVSFNMKKNKAQGFKESLSSPITPFNPLKTPESGILKSPASQSSLVTPVQTAQPSASHAANSDSPMAPGNRKRRNDSPQTPITRQTFKQDQVFGTPGHTPVISVGFERKKTTPARRMKAKDFFL